MGTFEKYIEFYERVQNLIFGSAFKIKKITDSNLRNELNRNRKFYNIHSGERCFILGNGPSLKNIDFTKLEKEYVFTVNQANRNPDFYKLITNYHVWIDSSFFDAENISEDFLDIMKGINVANKYPVCFFPYEQIDFIKKYKIDEILDINFIYCKAKFHENYTGKWRLDSIMPTGLATVVQMAILIAVYMGFSEIILLGCDSTGIVVSVNSALKQNSNKDYSYEVTLTEKKRMESLIERNSLEHYALSYANLFKYFRRITSYCNKNGIRLLNASNPTVLTEMPKVRILEIEKRG